MKAFDITSTTLPRASGPSKESPTKSHLCSQNRRTSTNEHHSASVDALDCPAASRTGGPASSTLRHSTSHYSTQ